MGSFFAELRRRHIYRIGAGFVCAWVIAWAGPVSAQTSHTIPDFSGLWTRTGGDRGSFDPPPGSGPGPIMTDQRYPRRSARSWQDQRDPVSTEIIRIVGGWVPDLTNPILQPHTRERLSEIAEQELADYPHVQLQTMCMAPGVPHILNLFEHMQVLQMRDKIVFLYSRNNHVRHVDLDQPHNADRDHTWWGDSVGHYEGDTLVVDTYGLNDKTNVDRYGTPHSEKIHVVERYRMSDDGSTLEILFTVEDHETFTVPWSARADYIPDNYSWVETICPENAERQFWPGRTIYVPTDETPDF